MKKHTDTKTERRKLRDLFKRKSEQEMEDEMYTTIKGTLSYGIKEMRKARKKAREDYPALFS